MDNYRQAQPVECRCEECRYFKRWFTGAALCLRGIIKAVSTGYTCDRAELAAHESPNVSRNANSVSRVSHNSAERREGGVMAKHKIRIAVAVDQYGDWNCCGWGNVIKGTANEQESMVFATETTEEGERRYWVEAEIEVPSVDVLPGVTAPA